MAERLGLNPTEVTRQCSVGNGRPFVNQDAWVRFHLSSDNSSSWSSLECSPACHGGDRGFKSRRGRFA